MRTEPLRREGAVPLEAAPLDETPLVETALLT
jgi:hypothetical protein